MKETFLKDGIVALNWNEKWMEGLICKEQMKFLKTSTKWKQKDLKFGLSTGASPEYKTEQKQQTFQHIQRGSKLSFYSFSYNKIYPNILLIQSFKFSSILEHYTSVIKHYKLGYDMS